MPTHRPKEKEGVGGEGGGDRNDYLSIHLYINA